MKSRSFIFITILLFVLQSGTVFGQNIRKVEVFSSPLGNASSGEVAVVHSTGLVYTAGQILGSNFGVIDPNTNALIKVIRPADLNNQTGIFYSRVNQATNLVYFLQNTSPNSQIVVVDGRTFSPTFNQLLPAMVFNNQTIATFALDQKRNRLYVSTRTIGSSPVQSQIHIVDINPASATFHQILSTVVLPLGQQSGNVAVNSVTNKIYIASILGNGGVFVLNGATNTLTKIASTIQTSVIAVNEISNTIYAGVNGFINGTTFIQAIDGTTDIYSGNINLPGSVIGNFGENIAVNSTTERVYALLSNSSLAVIDAKRMSPNFNTVLANVANLRGNSGEVVVNEGLNRIVVAANNFTTSIIDGAANAEIATTRGNLSSLDVAINPFTNRAFVGHSLYTTQIINLNDNSYTNIGTGIEVGEGITNLKNNSFYFGRSGAIADIAFLDQNDNLGLVSGEPHAFGRILFAAQNTLTNRVYVVNSAANLDATAGPSPGYVSVVNAATNSVVANVEVGGQPFSTPAVNEATNKIYVMNAGFGQGFPSKISVINGATNTSSTVDTTAFPANSSFIREAAVNSTTNKIYFRVSEGVSIGVIDGTTDIATPLAGFTNISDIKVNPALNRIYLLTATGLRVLNGANDTEIANIALSSPSSMAINRTTGRIFIRSFQDQTLTAIDGNSNTLISSVALPGASFAMAVNETTNEVYAGASTDLNDESTSGVIFIDGNSLTVRKTLPIPLRPSRIVVNPTTKTLYVTTLNASQRTGIVVISDNTSATATGQNVTIVPANGVMLSFGSVATAGNTNVTALSPVDVPSLPSGFALIGSSQLYEISTSAVFTGNIVVSFSVPNITSAAVCSQLRILHYVNGDWDLSGNATPLYNAAAQTCTVSQTVSSLSPFVVAQILNTTIGPPVDAEQCKNDGWRGFNNPTFKNQGECVSYVNRNRRK